MAEEKFDTNLLRFIAAETFFSLCLQASREMFAKSYFSLGAAEKQAVDQAVAGTVMANYQAVTPQFLNPQASQAPIGFQAPTGAQSQESGKK